jgi:UDP-GlcNAc:undecaprenyl-phosphate/decaprenyl-phosphate GlcNAc-1-phosphate transferase
MRIAIITFVASLAAGALLTPLVRRFAYRIGAVDHALSSRKVHTTPLPRLGGIAIVGAFFVPLIALVLVDSAVGSLFLAHRDEVIGLFVGGAIIAALGICDDLKGTGAKLKFAVQFAVAAFAYKMGYRIDAIANPFGAPIQLGLFGLPFTMLWVAGVINAINLIDGLDGLAGGVAFIAVATTFVTAILHGEPVMAVVTAALAGAVLGFLRYNFNPASIFMGDTGSMFLGFVFATSAIHANHGSSAAVAILVPIVSLGLPITDTLLAMTRRYMRGAPLFQGDREHIHHRLLARGLSHRRSVLVLYGASGVCGTVALLLVSASGPVAAVALAAFALSIGLLLRRLGYLRLERMPALRELRRRNLELRASVRGVAGFLEHASELGEVWDTVKQALPALGARSVALRVISQNARGHQRTQHFVSEEPRTAGASLHTRHTLLAERPDAGVLELGWGDGRAKLDRDTELAVELLCRHVHGALARLGPVGPEAVDSRHRHVVARDVRPSKSNAGRARRVAGG